MSKGLGWSSGGWSPSHWEKGGSTGSYEAVLGVSMSCRKAWAVLAPASGPVLMLIAQGREMVPARSFFQEEFLHECSLAGTCSKMRKQPPTLFPRCSSHLCFYCVCLRVAACLLSKSSAISSRIYPSHAW